jgi:uncharacterized phage protein (TIGR01671 family)
MERRIKFRAWTKKKEMQYNVVPFEWDYVIDTMWHKCIESNGHGILGSGGTEAKFEVGGYAIEEGDLMQYTGLKDKNNKEIYEGDMVFYEDHEWEVRLVYDRWDMVNGDKTVRDDDFADDPGWTSWGFCEIIGNIYENPELLK